MSRIIIAMGGNAIQTGEATAEAQQLAIRSTVQQLMPILTKGMQVVITHGNGPQVGQLMLQQKAANSALTPALPLNTCVAMTQGMIGCWIQQEFDRMLQLTGGDTHAVTVMTQVEVDGADSAFKNPTKPIGPFYSEEECRRLSQENPGQKYVSDAGRGFRRVVASPKPQNILEVGSIKTLLAGGQLVIAAGGGGIPVIKSEKGLELVDAVIDKDLTSARLAQQIEADELIILTAVDNVYIRFGTPKQTKLERVTVSEMENYIEEGHFAAGSMLPKVIACCDFVRNNPGRRAVISSLNNIKQVLDEKAGTVICA